MRKRYSVIEAKRTLSPTWWANLKATEPEDLPVALLGIAAGNVDKSEAMTHEEADEALSWAQGLGGWWGEGPDIKTKRGDHEHRPLVRREGFESTTETSSGAYVVYHISQAENPDLHNRRRGDYYFEPRDYTGAMPYTSGFKDPETAMHNAEEHEREEERKRNPPPAEGQKEEGGGPALRAPPRALRRSPVSVGAAPGGARLASQRSMTVIHQKASVLGFDSVTDVPAGATVKLEAKPKVYFGGKNLSVVASAEHFSIESITVDGAEEMPVPGVPAVAFLGSFGIPIELAVCPPGKTIAITVHNRSDKAHRFAASLHGVKAPDYRRKLKGSADVSVEEVEYDVRWLYARAKGDKTPHVDPERGAAYERLEAALKGLPLPKPREGWIAIVLNDIAGEKAGLLQGPEEDDREPV